MMRPRLLAFERTWAFAAFDAIYPDAPDAGLPHGIARLGPAEFFDALLAEIPLEQSVGLRFALWMVALAPIFTIRRFALFSSLDERDRCRVLGELLASPIYAVRQLTLSLKAMAALLYGSAPSIHAAMTAPRGENVVALRLSGARTQPRGGSGEHAAE